MGEGRRILITGAAGFVGRSLARALAADDLYLAARPGGNLDIPGAHIVPLDLARPLDESVLPSACEIVVHEAALAGSDQPEGDPEVFRVNVTATQELLDWARRAGVRKFIFASTSGVYGYSAQPLSEAMPTNPINYYTLTKALGEELCRYHSRHFDVVVHRYFFPYGPGQTRGLIPTLADRILSGQEITVYNDENPRTNPTFIEDVIACTEASLSLDGFQVVNIAGPDTVSVRELAVMLGRLLGRESKFRREEDPRIGDLAADRSDMRALGLRAETGLRDGLERFVESYASRR